MEANYELLWLSNHVDITAVHIVFFEILKTSHVGLFYLGNNRAERKSNTYYCFQSDCKSKLFILCDRRSYHSLH